MEFQTTFMEDFRIANMFGIDAVKDTFDRAFNEWKDNVVYGTELCIVMNIYCWHFCDTNPQLSELYADYYYKVRDYCLDNYKGDDWQYFWHKIDLYYGDYSFIPS